MLEKIGNIILEKVISIESEVKLMRTDLQTGFVGVNKKLDTIYAQVAHNTEQEVKLNEVAIKVEDLGTDVRLIKKLVSNQ
jgi:hypothetical protein